MNRSRNRNRNSKKKHDHNKRRQRPALDNALCRQAAIVTSDDNDKLTTPLVVAATLYLEIGYAFGCIGDVDARWA